MLTDTVSPELTGETAHLFAGLVLDGLDRDAWGLLADTHRLAVACEYARLFGLSRERAVELSAVPSTTAEQDAVAGWYLDGLRAECARAGIVTVDPARRRVYQSGEWPEVRYVELVPDDTPAASLRFTMRDDGAGWRLAGFDRDLIAPDWSGLA